MSTAKQSVKIGVWYIGGKKRKKQKGARIPLGIFASVAGPILSEVRFLKNRFLKKSDF